MPKKLNARERLFVEECAKGANPTQAVRKIQPTSRRPDILGSKLMAKPHVKAALEAKLAKLAEKVGVTQEEWFREVWGLASAKLPANKRVSEAGKIRALELAGRHLGAFKDTAGERETIGPGLTIIIQNGTQQPVDAKVVTTVPAVGLMPGPER